MNFYLLTEGRTEEVVYRYWMTYLFPGIKQVQRFDHVKENNFIVKSSSGYPFRNSVLADAMHTCNMYPKIDYLILVADTDDESIPDRRAFIFNQMYREGLHLKYGKLAIFLQKKCFESWCLGSMKFNPEVNFDSNYKKYVSFYNVREHDPEKMKKPVWFKKSNSIFHFFYFREMMKQSHQRYNKAHPGVVAGREFFTDLIKRTEETPHIGTFREFYDFMEKLAKSES